MPAPTWAGCNFVKLVCKNSCTYSGIQAALNSFTTVASGAYCVVLQDAQTYNERVTIQNFTNNGSSLTIMVDPVVTVHPVINPPALSTAAFLIMDSTISIWRLESTSSVGAFHCTSK